MIEFCWDEKKNKINRQKHGVWFEEAQTVFNDPHGRLFLDETHSIQEERFILFGFSNADRLLAIVHCYRSAQLMVRIISARRATPKERKFYEKRV